jgi:hypothetical protein
MSVNNILCRSLSGIAVIMLLATSAQANVNKSIRIDAGTQAGGQSTVNGSITVGSDAVIDGSLETVNGSIRVDDNSRFSSASTVNGSIRLGDGIATDAIESVNGTIRIGGNATISGSVEVVNGKIEIGGGSSVGKDVSNVNGEITIEGTEIGGDLSTVLGDVTLTDGSVVNGDLIIEKPGGWGWGRNRRKPRIVIGPASRVVGNIVAEHEIELYLSDSATVGGVTGEASMDSAVRFSGNRP